LHPHDLRVALFSGNYNYQKDGANNALNRLVAHLLARGVTARIYSPTTGTPAFPPTGDLVSVPSVPVPGRPEYRAALGLPEEIRADIRHFAPAIIHVSAPDFLGHRAVSLARQMGVPAVASVHTFWESYFRYYHLGWAVPLGERLLRRFYGRCVEVYAPSQAMADLLREKQLARTIHLWERGVDRALFHPGRRDMGWRRSLGVADDEILVAFVGRLVLEKGLDVLAATADTAARAGLRLRWLVVGDGPALPALKARFPDALFTGALEGEALARAYSGADLFVFPSRTDTFGLVLVEAMASGLAVAAYPVPGPLDVVADSGAGVLDEDLGRAVTAALRIPRAAALARAADFSWDRAVDQFAAAIDEAAPQRAAASLPQKLSVIPA